MPKNPDIEKNNPCLKEYNLSSRCLQEHNYIGSECEVYFKNYNNCKTFWGKVRSDRRSKGIEPFLPDILDRPQIKAEYIKKGFL